MQKDKESTAGPLFRALLSLDIYKRSQGRIVRQSTFGALLFVVILGAWRLSVFCAGMEEVYRYWIPLGVLLLGGWLSFRAVCWPKFADFLISVEAEMAKVSWPTRGELIRQSIVVLFTIFALAILLFAYDVIWNTLFMWMGIVERS